MKQATARAAANWRRVYAMPVASVYPSYIAKAEKKGRTRAEVDEIFRWLTGHSQTSLEAEFAKKTSFGDFFAHAPKMNPSRFLITGVVCGVRVEEIQEPMMREIRYLDKLIDELAKGKAMEKIPLGRAAVLCPTFARGKCARSRRCYSACLFLSRGSGVPDVGHHVELDVAQFVANLAHLPNIDALDDIAGFLIDLHWAARAFEL